MATDFAKFIQVRILSQYFKVLAVLLFGCIIVSVMYVFFQYFYSPLHLPGCLCPSSLFGGTEAARYLCNGEVPHPQLLISRTLRMIPTLALACCSSKS